MTTRIGLISDIHACCAPVQEAFAIFRREKVAMVLCAGDVAGYGTELARTVDVLVQSKCTTVLGNHDAWYLEDAVAEQAGSARAYFLQLPSLWESVIEGIRIYSTHASPPESLLKGIRLLDEHGNILLNEKKRWADQLHKYPFDVLVVGHTHQVFAERLGDKLIINPGSTKFNHTCVVLSLPEMDVRVFPLSGKKPLKSWNWGMMTGGSALSGNQ